MNGRLSLAECKEHLKTVLNDDSVLVGTTKDRNYTTDLAKVWPAVWVGAQRARSLDDGSGYSGQYRQTMRIEIAIRVVLPRFVDGETDAEPRETDLCDRVSAAMLTWQPAGADQGFAWVSSGDGPAAESVLVVDMVFFTEATYARNTP